MGIIGKNVSKKVFVESSLYKYGFIRVQWGVTKIHLCYYKVYQVEWGATQNVQTYFFSIITILM